MTFGFQQALENFFSSPPREACPITNERSLQLELAYFFRREGWSVAFELPLRAPRLEGSTLKQKYNLDLLLQSETQKIGMELKVPVNGQHPETIYSYCADLEFIESLKRAAVIHAGFCVMVTHDSVFWTDSGRGSSIHTAFRSPAAKIAGLIGKPTGPRDTCVVLENEYQTSGSWKPVSDRLMPRGRYLCLAV